MEESSDSELPCLELETKEAENKSDEYKTSRWDQHRLLIPVPFKPVFFPQYSVGYKAFLKTMVSLSAKSST